MPFTVTYTQRSASQPGAFDYMNLGPKWNCNWLGYVTDNAGDPATVLSLSLPGGGRVGAAYWSSDGTNEIYQLFGMQGTRLLRPITNGLPYEVVYADGSKEVYGQADGSLVSPRRVFLTQRIDPSGNATTLSYDASMRVVKITDALGQETVISYESALDPLKVTKVTDPFGRFATFEYDTTGRLTKITDVIGIQSAFTYEGVTDFINSMTTPYGTTRFTNSENGTVRRITATDPAGDTEVMESNSGITAGIPASEASELLPAGMTVANANLNSRNSFHWNKRQWAEGANNYTNAHVYHWLLDNDLASMSGILESEKPPLQSRIWYRYADQTDAQVAGLDTTPYRIGRVIEGGTSLIKRTTTGEGKIDTETDPLGRVTTYQYQNEGTDIIRVAQNISGTQQTLTGITYDDHHRPLTVTNASGSVTSYTWNERGQKTSERNAKNEVTTYNYYADNAPGKQRKGRLASIDGPLTGNGDVVTFDYDAVGNVASVTEPDGYSLNFTYDALDRPKRVTFPDGTFEETTYQALDPSSSRDRLGRITTYVYNSIRQLASMTDPANRTVQYKWCKCGDLKQLIDAMGRVTTWRHDVAGRVTAKEYVDGSRITYQYEPLSGRLKSVTDEKGQIKNRSYNLDGTLAGISYANAERATPNVAFTYDADFPRIIRMVDGVGTTTYSYNPITASPALGAGRLAITDGPWANDTITYRYDELDRIAGQAINGVEEGMGFDAAGRVTNTTNALGVFTYAYEGDTARLASRTHSGGVKTVYDYFPNNQDRRLQRIRNLMPDGATPISVFDYTYDVAGRILTWKQQQDNQVATAQTWTLGYDEVDQLTSNTITQGGGNLSSSVWEYDKAGNRTKETVNGSATIFNFNALNQLFSTSANLPEMSYEWDAENRLIAINQGMKRSEFTYDGQGRRVKIVEKSNNVVVSTDTYVWDGLEEREKRDGTGAIVRQRFYSQGVQGVSGSLIGAHLYLKDHLGSIRELVGTSGSLRERITYDAWGKPTFSNTTPVSSFAFTGHFWHANSELSLAQFRGYSAVKARWISRDLLEELDGVNVYVYSLNNPVNYTDPLGLAVIINYSDGTTQKAATATEFQTLLISSANGSIESIEIRGHANPNFQSFDPLNPRSREGLLYDATTVRLTDGNGGKFESLESLFQNKFNSRKNSGIELGGCSPARGNDNITRALSRIVPGVKVMGSPNVRWQIWFDPEARAIAPAGFKGYINGEKVSRSRAIY